VFETFAGAPAGALERFILAHAGEIGAYLDRACRRSGGRYTAEIILRHVLQGGMGLWLVLGAETGRLRGVMATCILTYETGLREAQISAVAGDGIGMRRLRAWMPLVLDWARSWGCDVLYYEGRRAFLRTGPWRMRACSAEIRL